VRGHGRKVGVPRAAEGVDEIGQRCEAFFLREALDGKVAKRQRSDLRFSRCEVRIDRRHGLPAFRCRSSRDLHLQLMICAQVPADADEHRGHQNDRSAGNRNRNLE